MKPLLKHSARPLLVLLAAAALLVQCFGGLSVSGLSADGNQSLFLQSDHGTEYQLSNSFEVAANTHTLMAFSPGESSMAEMPVMSCCEDESQPITLAELQLLPLIFLVGLIAVVFSISRNSKPKAPFLSPRIRLHKLHCCWLN